MSGNLKIASRPSYATIKEFKKKLAESEPQGIGRSESGVIPLHAEKQNFCYNPSLYLEIALQDINYGYSSIEYYLTVIRYWVSSSPEASGLRAHVAEIGSTFIGRKLSNNAQKFAASLAELGVAAKA